MNIRNRHAKVCLFLWILGMCLAVHPIKAQSVIPVPLKMEQGADYFFLSEKDKALYKLRGGRSETLGELSASTSCFVEERFEKGRTPSTFTADNRKE